MGTKNLLPRIWLTLVAIGQIVFTPIAAFTITYMFDFTIQFDPEFVFSVEIREDLFRWIIGASFYSGITALSLALIVGGFSPNPVVKRGGWLSTLKLSNKPRDADLISRAKLQHKNSPYGQMIKLISDQHGDGKSIIAIFGGLQLLAIPFQFAVVVIPWIILMLLLPWANNGQLLELVVICYLIVLIISLRIFPKVASKFITFATFARRWLVSMTKLSIFFPILVLWMLGRLATVLVVGLLGSSIDITAEQDFIVGLMGGATVPQNSFLDLMTALSVLPLAAFTTLTVLGGANKGLPQWLKVDDDWIRPDKPEPIPEVKDLLDEW
ncbi:MAG: hypothetical protein CMB56_000050 [Methanobacteriota archaeon]|nr:MAG: hypothetical protein CMB56_000050 [Euryarchaeota archaeon]